MGASRAGAVFVGLGGLRAPHTKPGTERRPVMRFGASRSRVSPALMYEMITARAATVRAVPVRPAASRAPFGAGARDVWRAPRGPPMPKPPRGPAGAQARPRLFPGDPEPPRHWVWPGLQNSAGLSRRMGRHAPELWCLRGGLVDGSRGVLWSSEPLKLTCTWKGTSLAPGHSGGDQALCSRLALCSETPVSTKWAMLGAGGTPQ